MDTERRITDSPGAAEAAHLAAASQISYTLPESPLIAALNRIADEIKLLRETIHDAVVGELVE